MVMTGPNSGDAILDAQLAPIWGWLTRRDVLEVVAVEPGAVLIETERGWRQERAAKLTERYWRSLCEVLANRLGRLFCAERQPQISTRLPGGHRFEAMAGVAVEGGVSVSIRVARRRLFELTDYGLSSAMANEIIGRIVAGDNTIISGGTSSGKTTFLNSVLRHIPATDRVLTVEDTREIILTHVRNRAHYEVDRHGAGAVGYPQIFDHLMRSRPDRIIAGELSIASAQPTLMLLSTGHRGFLTTLHADSAREALESAFYDRLQLGGGADRNQQHLADYLRRTVDLVVQVSRADGQRRVTEVWRPKDEDMPHTIEGPNGAET